MKKEFKFIKGLYTNKNLFDDEIVNESLIILDSNSVQVAPSAIDDANTQSQLINASNDNVCKLYTITPSQITMSGSLSKGDVSIYEFTPNVNKRCENDDEEIPDNVKTKAEQYLKNDLTANWSNLEVDSIGIGKNTSPSYTVVNFEYNNKEFTKDLRFRVEGYVTKKSLKNLNKNDICTFNDPVYIYDSNNKAYRRYNNEIKFTLFTNGRKQKPKITLYHTPMQTADVIISQSPILLPIAETYRFKYRENGDIINILSYQEVKDLNGTYYLNGTTMILTFQEDNGYTYLFKEDVTNSMYIVEDNNYVELGKTYMYNSSISVYDFSELTNDETDPNIYKTIDGAGTSVEVDQTYVKLTNIYTIAPNYHNDYIIEITSDTKISARES